MTCDLSIYQCTVIQTCRVGPKQKFQIWHGRIFKYPMDFRTSVVFCRIWNSSQP